MAQWPNQNRARAAVAALDLVVHLELFRNATSRFADYLLPMASGIEKGGTTRFAEDRRIVWNDRFIDPPGEARSDHWFWIELGKRFGFDDVLKEDYKNPRKLWDEVLLAATPELGEQAASTLVGMAVFSVAALCMEKSRLERPALVDLATERVMSMLLAPTPAPRIAPPAG